MIVHAHTNMQPEIYIYTIQIYNDYIRTAKKKKVTYLVQLSQQKETFAQFTRGMPDIVRCGCRIRSGLAYTL